MRWKHLPIVAFDTETTGLQPFAGDRIIEFGAVVLRLDEAGETVVESTHSWLINPQIPIPKKVTEITGIADGDVAGAKRFYEIAPEVFDLLSGKIAVAHNFPFDMAFLSKELSDADLHWPEPLAEVDTVDVSMQTTPEARSHKLADVCKRLGIDLDNAHRATDDAEACGRVFLELAKRSEVADDLQQMLTWARAIGQPPAGAPIGPNDEGRVVFLEGEHEGKPVGSQPLHLAWMEKARVRGPDGWTFRYTESTRAWIRRWLAVRGSGRHRPNPKSFRSEDWVLDPCIAEPLIPPGTMRSAGS